MAQQLKFVACLKILMEELSTLATGFEVDGEESVIAEPEHCGTPVQRLNEKPTLHEILMAEKMDFEAKVQRASRRKKWLKANEALLRTLLSYCSLHGASGGGLAAVRMELVLLLQELQQEKSQQQLLSPLPFPTTLPLLSASVACHKTVVADPVRHLQCPAPESQPPESSSSSFLSFASFLAETPRLQAQTHDMLATIMELRGPPAPSRMLYHSEVFVLRDLAVALSACIYQSLCDSDTFSVKQQPSDNFPPSALESLARLNIAHSSSHLISGQPPRRRRFSSDEPLQVTTHPSKWPGVTNLRALLAREKDEDTPRLNILLVEAFVATYMSLVVYALSTCDSLILYRLVGQHFSQQTWAFLFGGGVKKLLRVAASNPTPQTPQTPQSAGPGSLEREGSASEGSGVWTAVTSLTKQRYRLNMRLLGQFGSQGGAPHMKEDKPTYREQFVPPEMSMISYFLMKPQLSAEAAVVDYDSAESAESEPEDEEEEEDVFEGSGTGIGGASRLGATREPSSEHTNPGSFSWCVLRLAIARVVQRQLHEFLNAAGIELPELPVLSPLVHGVLRTVAQWQELLADELDQRRPPPADYIPGCYVEPTTTGPAIHKYRSLLEASNTPFHGRHASAAPARRLWRYLVRQELVQEIFIRAVFGKRRSVVSMCEPLCGLDSTRGPSEDGAETGTAPPPLPEPVKIIHKDQDSISAFCLNQVPQSGSGLMALATPREVQEMDISLLLESPSWLEDE
ncbi:Uncharacterized protein GBIM_14433 [Gryllus bimaculatus]|nr:Uncharacterized protein GBIM_14433 [Gryllus bimaculatus]